MKLTGLVLFLFIYMGGFAQYKSLLHKPYKDKVNDIGILYANVVAKKDSASAFAYIAEFKNWAVTNQDRQLVLEAELLRAFYYNVYALEDPKRIQHLIAIAEKGKKENVPNIEERAVQAIARYYWNIDNYQKSFEWYLRSAKILDKMNPADFPNMAQHLILIGDNYYFFRDYDSAIIYYKKTSVLEKTSFNYLSVINAQNTLGLCHQKLGSLALAEESFRKIIEDTSQYHSPVWKGIASGNLGYNYYLQDEYEKAIPLLKIDVEYALKDNIDYGLASGSTIWLADIYLKKNQLKESKIEIDSARRYINISGQQDRLRELYPVMSKWFAQSKMPDSSKVYVDSTVLSIKNYNEKYNSLKLLRASQNFQAKENALEMGNLKTKSSLMLAHRNLIITIVVFLLLAILLVFWFRNKYLMNKQQLKELALENTEKELKTAKSKLENLTLKVQSDINRILALEKEKSSLTNQNSLSDLRKKNILTQEDWTQYQELFTQIYPSFLEKLEASYSTLTKAEKRILCLLKLHLSNNEMALLMGISSNSVMVTNHRIRKKLSLETQDDLQELVREL